MEPLISVIIPIYKAEKYIENCVKSVLNQTYRNLEILLIDDGSPDKSGEICDKLAISDKRITVIHKKNGGAATARNVGLEQMKGQYVAFVDADDYMEENYLETLYGVLKKHGAQVSICSFKVVDENGHPVAIDSLHEDTGSIESEITTQVYTGDDIIMQDLQGHWEHVAPWGKLYDVALFKSVRFPEWFAHEDEPVFIQVFDKVTCAAATNQKLYYYVQHAGSLMNTAYSEKDRVTLLKMWRERIAYYSDSSEKHKKLLNPVRQAFVAWGILYLSLHADEMNSEQQNEIKKEIRQHFDCLLRKPYLYNRLYNVKLIVKATLTLINIKILRKRYANK